MIKKKLKSMLNFLISVSYAANTDITHTGIPYNPTASSITAADAVSDGVNGGVTFTDAIRTVYSKEIEFKALPNMRFHQFATRKTELGVEPGLTISMLTYDNLKRGGALTEMDTLKTQALSGSTKSLTVTEFGNAVSFSEKLIQSSFDDIMATASTLLGRDYALVVDCELRDTALSNTANVVYGGQQTGRDAITAADTFNTTVLKDAIEILSTANAPKWGGRDWICFIHPHQSRTLRDDDHWIEASHYGAPEQLFNGEIGRIDDVRFIDTTLLCNGAAAADDPAFVEDLKKGVTPQGASSANQVNIYQAVLFGDAYYGMATSLPVEMRDNGVEDFGRTRSLAWYSIFGTGLLHEQYGVVIETA